MSWNHRVLASKEGDYVFFEVHDVYYDEEGNPNGYAAKGTSVCGDNIDEMRWQLKHIENALKKPILWKGERFPEKYKTETND